MITMVTTTCNNDMSHTKPILHVPDLATHNVAILAPELHYVPIVPNWYTGTCTNNKQLTSASISFQSADFCLPKIHHDSYEHCHP